MTDRIAEEAAKSLLLSEVNRQIVEKIVSAAEAGMSVDRTNFRWRIAMIKEIGEQLRIMLEELLSVSKLEETQLLVVGCSSSEIASHKIGSYSNSEIGQAVFDVIYQETTKRGIYLAAQCCEHLNRALILPEEAAKRYGYEQVNAVPQLKAGGSFATAAYGGLKNPVTVERIQAHAGIDIGDTLIGMHLRPVAVPVRTAVNQIGGAHVVCARTRPKYIGGERAKYL